MSEVIVLDKTSIEFKKGFIFAFKSIADMGLSNAYPTKESLLKQINDMILIFESSNFVKD